MKKILMLLAIAAAAMQLSAADVDLTTAQNAARSFMTKQVATGHLRAAAASNLKLVKAETSVAKPTAVDYYIFNTDKSYVVVAGDDQAPEILMYGEEGALDLNNIPPGMQWLLNKYKYQIDGIKAGTLKAVQIPKLATTAVAPLVTANWDQTKPYYNHTPTSGSTHAYTGCPATSLAMCFYKWKWPDTYPAIAALSGTGGLSCDALSEKEADWDNMIDEYTGPSNYSYTTAQAEAVSWLMRYVGQACNMQYSTSGSGANDPEILEACHTFGYTDAQLLILTELVSSGWSYTNSEQYYTDSEWNNYMMTELQNGRPIEYLAYDISGYSVSGHAFNVFGCNSSGQYYVNWGWSGDSNGYCTLHNFTTATGSTGQSGSYVFNYGEAMIVGIEPPGTASTPSISADPTSLTFSGEVGQTYTQTVTVTGMNLEGNVTAAISGNSAYTIDKTTITKSAATNGATLTVTYTPTTAGNSTATITLSSSNASNVTVSISGTATAPTPTLTVSESTLAFGNCITGNSTQKTFTVTGENLTSTVYLNLTDANGVFTLSSNSITATQAAQGKTITVTFTPEEAMSYTGTIRVTSTGATTKTISLSGTGTLQKADPVMAAANESYIKNTSFRADWSDQTPAANVSSYTLWVSTHSDVVEPTLLEDADFSSLEAVTTSDGYLSNVASTASEYLPTGWTAQSGLWINDGFIISGYLSSTACGITSPTYDFTGYDKVTVEMSAYSYYASYYGDATISVSTSAGSQQIELGSDDFSTYQVVLDVASSDQVVIAGVENMFAIESIKIYAGDITATTNAPLRAAAEEGDATYRIITGITDKYYTVNDLTAGGTFDFKVKAIYTDNTESNWSNIEQVTLSETEDPTTLWGDVNLDGAVDVTDVNIVVNIILGNDNAANYDGRADLNSDGAVDVSDVNTLIGIVMGNTTSASKKAAHMLLMPVKF